MWVLGFRVWGFGSGVWGLGSGVWGLGFGVWGSGFGVQGGGGARLHRGCDRGVAPCFARDFFIDKLLVRIHFLIVMITWTGLDWRVNGKVNSLFQVALHLPS